MAALHHLRRTGEGSLQLLMTSGPDLVFLSGVRTGFGAFGGTLKDLSATDLGTVAARAAIERAGIAAADVDTS